MQRAIFLERVTRNHLALNLSVFSNVRRIAKPEMVEPDHNDSAIGDTYIWKGKDVCG